MKKVLLFFLAAAIVFSSCKKEDDESVFGQTFDERVNGSMAKYQSVLAGAENGWKAYITVDHGQGGTYSFYMKFNNDNRVTMLSDFDTTSAVTPKESSFRLRQQQQPTLIFDTYSYVHVLADPNENVVIFSNVNGGAVGEGLLSDFEFIIDPNTMQGDTIELTGKVNGARLVMVKATKEEADIFLEGRWVLLENYLTKKLLTYYKRITIGGVEYDLSNDPYEKTITFQTVVNGVVEKHTTGYYNTVDGIVLYDPLVTATGEIDEIKLGDWDGATSTLHVTVGNQPTTITETVMPLPGALDKDAPNTWIQFADANDSYWITISGFHVNGVDDAFGIMTLPRYYFLGYFPANYFATQYNLFAPVFIDATGTALELQYYSFISFTTDVNGIAKFRLRGNSTNPPFPSGTNPARLTRNLFLSTAGFYFVQVSETQYDMVSALDGKAWLRWEF